MPPKGHGYKLYWKTASALKNNYFSKKVVNLWNKLNEETIYSDLMELFKIGLLKFGLNRSGLSYRHFICVFSRYFECLLYPNGM